MPYLKETYEDQVRRDAERLASKKPTLHRIILEASNGARAVSLQAQSDFLHFTLMALAAAEGDPLHAAALDECRRELRGLADTLQAARCPLHKIGSLRQAHVTAVVQLWKCIGLEAARVDRKRDALQKLIEALGKASVVQVPSAL